jgi:hypothetical protein
MANSPPTEQERNDNLDALQEAVDEWAVKEKERIENEVQFLRKVRKGRTGDDKASTRNLAQAEALIVAEINNFLIFG